MTLAIKKKDSFLKTRSHDILGCPIHGLLFKNLYYIINGQNESKNDNIITSLRTSRMTHGIRYCHARNKTSSGNPKSVAQRKCVICRFRENPIVIDPRPGDVSLERRRLVRLTMGRKRKS